MRLKDYCGPSTAPGDDEEDKESQPVPDAEQRD